MKIAVNRCFGGFSLSKKAYKELGIRWDNYGFAFSEHDKRTDPHLIAVIEKLGPKANGSYARLEVVTIPDDIDWEIDEYDGSETVHEKHRCW